MALVVESPSRLVAGGGAGAGQAVDAPVAEPVAGAFNVRTSAWLTMRSIMAAATTWSPKTPPPAGEWQVGGEDQRGVLVPAGDELEEQVGGVLLEGQVADFVDDDEAVAAQPHQVRRVTCRRDGRR